MIRTTARDARFIFSALTLLAIVLAVCTTVTQLAGCGPNRRAETIKAAVILTDTAWDTFVRWSADRQMKIVELNDTREGRETQQTEHLKRQQAIRDAFAFVYGGLARAAVAKDQASLDHAVSAANELAAAFKNIKPEDGGPAQDALPGGL